MDVKVTTPATITSITKDLVKENKRILYAHEDNIIDFWIKVADAYVENATNTSLMKRTLRMAISKVLPVVQLPFPPLYAAPTSIKYTLSGQTEVIVNPATDVTTTTVYMLPTLAITSLDGYASRDGKMTIDWEAGYNDPNLVPFQLRQASLLLASHYLSSREAAYLDPKAILIERKIAFGVDDLVQQLRVPNTNATINGGY